EMYLNDADDVIFPAYWYDPNMGGLTTPDNMGMFRWPWLLTPYTKNLGVFRSPSDTVDLALPSCAGGCRDPKNPFYGYLWGLFPSYGFNWFYQAPDYTWNSTLPASAALTKNSRGLAVTSLGDPAATVLLADSTYGDADLPEKVGMG